MVKKINYTEYGNELYFKDVYEVMDLIENGAWLIFINEKGKKQNSVIQLWGLGDKNNDFKPLLREKNGQLIEIRIRTLSKEETKKYIKNKKLK